MAIVLDGTAGITSPAETIQGNLTTTGNTILGDASTDTLNVGNGGLVKDASGNVGIGTASPAAKLDVNGSIRAIGNTTPASGTGIELVYDSSSTSSYITSYNRTGSSWVKLAINSASTTFDTGGTTRMTLDSSGNLGLGVTPSAWGSGRPALEIGGSTQPTIAFNGSTVANGGGIWTNGYNNGGNNLYKYTGTASRLDTGNGGFAFYLAPSGTAGNAITFTQAMTLDASGNLLVGTTSRVNSGVLSVLANSGGSYVSNGIGIQDNSNGSGFQFLSFQNASGTQIGTVARVGTTNAVAYSTSSDYRLKENVAPMTGALDTVAKLKPVTYKWKADGSDGQGFIAHELAEVVPDCVSGEKDATKEEEYEISPAIPAVLDEEGNEVTPAVEAVIGTRTVPVYQGIDTSFLVATLTAAIQEQQAMIDELKAKVAALEAA
jgi:hypothetical protein